MFDSIQSALNINFGREFKFVQHIAEYNLSFDSMEEFLMRREIFINNDIAIAEENASQTNYQVGHNAFSTWTEDELAKLRTLKREEQPEPRTYWSPDANQALPTTWNWNDQGCVTGVKNQGQCGSCWAFSSTGALEGSHCIVSGGNLLSFSEQQLVDCAGLRWGNFGCNGGLQQYAFNYYEKFYAMSEEAYPYAGVDQPCAYDATNTTGVNVVSWAWVTPLVASGIEAALYTQPLSISIQANQICFQFYKSGVLTNTNCGTNLDHAVLMVGWGVDPTAGPYWTIKNSWGTSWGEAGYIQIQQVADGNGICGCQMEPLFPTANM
jgi:C1A family cysteine protease